MPALKVEQPGDVVPLEDFVKIHPQTKTVLDRSKPLVRAIARRTGGPSKAHDTAASPNQIHPQPRPVRNPAITTEQHVNLSFFRAGGTLSSQPNKDQYQSRWSKTKKGVV